MGVSQDATSEGPVLYVVIVGISCAHYHQNMMIPNRAPKAKHSPPHKVGGVLQSISACCSSAEIWEDPVAGGR